MSFKKKIVYLQNLKYAITKKEHTMANSLKALIIFTQKRVKAHFNYPIV